MRLIGHLIGLYVAPEKGAAMQRLDMATAETGRGLVGDRYHARTGTFSQRDPLVPGARALSILDTRTLAICRQRLGGDLDAARLRRNLLLESDVLHSLRGRMLLIGEVRVVLTGRCPPCGYLSRLLDADMRRALHGFGGMRASIVAGGTLHVDAPVWLAEAPVGRHGLPG
ncbi:MAG: MOSC domain-containing protein [Salinisphaera sp.]|uniref:MOSC domain-containing protein n=1 Tax=Salinisphaera sp. TaxID=1914330 RepID=UPI003C7D8E26